MIPDNSCAQSHIVNLLGHENEALLLSRRLGKFDLKHIVTYLHVLSQFTQANGSPTDQ